MPDLLSHSDAWDVSCVRRRDGGRTYLVLESGETDAYGFK